MVINMYMKNIELLNHFSIFKGEASPSIYADWINGG